MRAIIIYGNGSEATDYQLTKAVEAITKTGDFEVINVAQLSDSELSQAIAMAATKLPVTAIVEIERPGNTISYDEIKAAAVFLTETYGDPLDDEEAFRVRVQKVFWGGAPSNPVTKRTISSLEILSRLHNQKLPPKVNTYLKDIGLTFAKTWANQLFRYKDM